MDKQEYFEKAAFLWRTYVPPKGQAETVQGELIRAIEKLRDEAQRNGNANWDSGHVIVAHYIQSTLLESGIFTHQYNEQIAADIAMLLNTETLCLEDDIYDRLTERIVDWCIAHPTPLPHIPNPILHR